MKKKTLLAGLFVALVAVVSAISARTDLFVQQGTGTYRNIDVFRIDQSRDLRLYDGDIYLGDIGTTPSQSNYFSIKVPVYNVGAALSQGDVVIASNTGVGYVTASPATNDLTSVVGVADGAIASGAVGHIIIGGYAIVKTTGTVSIGDALVSTSTTPSGTGFAAADTTPTTGAKIGVAMESGTASGDTVLAILTLN